MKGIEAAFIARLGSDPEEKLSAKGVPWCSFSVAVTDCEQTTWVRIAAFADVAQRITAELRKGAEVYIEGTLRLSQWQDKRTGEIRHGLEVAAWRCDPLGQIGDRRPRERLGRAGRPPAGNRNGPSEKTSPGPSQALQASCAGNDQEIPF